MYPIQMSYLLKSTPLYVVLYPRPISTATHIGSHHMVASQNPALLLC